MYTYKFCLYNVVFGYVKLFAVIYTRMRKVITDQLKRTITASGDLATPTKSHVVSHAYHVTSGGCGLIFAVSAMQTPQ